MSKPGPLDDLLASVVCPNCGARDKVQGYLVDSFDELDYDSECHFTCEECSATFPSFIQEDHKPMKTCIETQHGIPQMFGKSSHCSLQRAYRHEGWWVIPVKYEHEE